MTSHFTLWAPLATWTKFGRSSNYFALLVRQKSIGVNLWPYGPTRKKRNGSGDKKLGWWIPEGQGVWYLSIQIGFQLPTKANFQKLMFTLKGKMITLGKCNLSFAGRILVAKQVLLSSMWYLAACWNPNPRMCNQIKRVVQNFIWGKGLQHTGQGQMGFSYTPLV